MLHVQQLIQAAQLNKCDGPPSRRPQPRHHEGLCGPISFLSGMRQRTLRQVKRTFRVTPLVSDRAGLGTQACVVLESVPSLVGAVADFSGLGCQIEPTKNTGHPVKFEFQINNQPSMSVSRVIVGYTSY